MVRACDGPHMCSQSRLPAASTPHDAAPSSSSDRRLAGAAREIGSLRRRRHLREQRPSSPLLLTSRLLTPMQDRVLVEKIAPPAKSVGGVLLPDSAVQKINSATVVAVGPGRRTASGACWRRGWAPRVCKGWRRAGALGLQPAPRAGLAAAPLADAISPIRAATHHVQASWCLWGSRRATRCCCPTTAVPPSSWTSRSERFGGCCGCLRLQLRLRRRPPTCTRPASLLSRCLADSH